MDHHRRTFLQAIGAAGTLLALPGTGRATSTAHLQPGVLIAGRTGVVSVVGGTPGDTAAIVLGPAGVGPGDCPPVVGTCLDVLGPPMLLGTARVRLNGVALVSFQVPAAAAGRVVGLQGFTGTTGAWAATDPVLAEVITAPPMLTSTQQEGPYYRPGAPARSDLDLYGDAGTPLIIEGHVVRSDGVFVANAGLDWWHADPAGQYDNTSADFRYRGRSRVTQLGGFRLRTLRPAPYSAGSVSRPAHLHLRVELGGQLRLTTQLYFADEPASANVPADLRLVTSSASGPQRATFTIVV